MTAVHPVDDILAHYGVLGMKWGRRKGDSDSASVAKPLSADAEAAQRFRKIGPNSLSNDELRQLNQRTQLEVDYARLNPSKYKKAKTVVAEVIAVGATVRTVHSMVNSPAGKAAREAVTAFLTK